MNDIRRVAAVGTFDGVHTGHQVVIDRVKQIAEEKGMEPIVITFDRHPLSLINPEKEPLVLTPLPRKEFLLRRLGVTPVIVSFNEQLRNTTAADWLKYIHEAYDVDELVAGYDNTFGCDGVNMSVSDYRRLGEKEGVNVSDAPMLEGVSSSAIRKAVSRGEIKEANKLLGRNYRIEGKVIAGKQIGRTLGYPTANLEIEPHRAMPAPGTYAATAILPDGSEWTAMVNIGKRPTLRRDEDIITEAHLVGFNGDLYNKKVILIFEDFIREEQEFENLELLKKQIAQDKEKIIEIINSGK